MNARLLQARGWVLILLLAASGVVELAGATPATAARERWDYDVDQHAFDDADFRARVDRSLATVRTLIDTTRQPTIPEDVSHVYGDKFLLAETTTNIAIASVLEVLRSVGLNGDKFVQLYAAGPAKHRTVSVRFELSHATTFLYSADRTVQSVRYSSGQSVRDIQRAIVTEYFWRMAVSYKLTAFSGAGDGPDDVKFVLTERAYTKEIVTRSPDNPLPAADRVLAADLTWLFEHAPSTAKRGDTTAEATDSGSSDSSSSDTGDSGSGSTSSSSGSVINFDRRGFTIDRSDPSLCRTPRRNPNTASALRFFAAARGWARDVVQETAMPIGFGPNADPWTELNGAFDPIVPLFEPLKAQSQTAADGTEATTAAGAELRSTVVSFQLAHTVVIQHRAALRERRAKRDVTARAQAAQTHTISAADWWFIDAANQINTLCGSAIVSLNYVERMLYKQLFAGVGKELQPADMIEFTDWHMRQLYRPEYQPKPFSYNIRRESAAPEGVLSIETVTHDGHSRPVRTLVRQLKAAGPLKMKFDLDASTRVTFSGEQFVHGWVNQQFAGGETKLQLIARARQFSAFILLVGRIISSDVFDPQHAIIIRNRDELKVPLWLETIPTAKEFRDAIESLSPEQQRFARGFRAMQLSSTLFGVAIVQIKPALERVLNLDANSLTKEIELTRDLMGLFVRHQIPPDLLSYQSNSTTAAGGYGGVLDSAVADASSVVTASDKVAFVRACVAKLNAIITLPPPALPKASDGVPAPSPLRGHAAKRALKASPRFVETYGDTEMMPSFQDVVASFQHSARDGAESMLVHDNKFAPTIPAEYKRLIPSEKGGGGAQGTITPRAEAAAAGAQASTVNKPPSDPSQPTAPAADTTAAAAAAVPLTDLPRALEARLSVLDTETPAGGVDSALRPSIVHVSSDGWARHGRSGQRHPLVLDGAAQRNKRNHAFDLLDALTRSGLLELEHSQLHVFVAMTQTFDKTVVNTVIQSNRNPIELLERSSLLVAATVHGVEPIDLIQPNQIARLQELSPYLLPAAAAAPATK